MIVMFYLCGGKGVVQAQGITHEISAKLAPIYLRVGHVVRVVISGCSPKFGGKRNRKQQTQLLFQTFYKHPNFLTQTGRRGGLSVRAGQHGNLGPGYAHFFEFGNHRNQGF